MYVADAPTTEQELIWFMKEEKPLPVGTPSLAEVDRELTPILAELTTLGPGNDQHLSCRQLFNWLVDPQRTVLEFNYIIGSLAPHVYDIMEGHFKQYMFEECRGTCIYLGKIAAEALAMRSPVLEGSWEATAWMLQGMNNKYDSTEYGFASDQFITWIISVIGDSKLCPNSYLRIQLIEIFIVMADVNKHMTREALKSVMSACSILKMDYLQGDMTITELLEYLEMFDALMIEFDEKLSDGLHKEVNRRLAIIFHDFAYKHSVNPTTYKEPTELTALNNLLKNMSHLIQDEYKCFQKEGLYDYLGDSLNDISYAVRVLFKSFKLSIQTPQLIEFAASCIMDLLELVIHINTTLIEDRGMIYIQSLNNTNELLEDILDIDNDLPTTLLQETIFSKYGRLKTLSEKFIDLNVDNFEYPSTISHFLHDVYGNTHF